MPRDGVGDRMCGSIAPTSSPTKLKSTLIIFWKRFDTSTCSSFYWPLVLPSTSQLIKVQELYTVIPIHYNLSIVEKAFIKLKWSRKTRQLENLFLIPCTLSRITWRLKWPQILLICRTFSTISERTWCGDGSCGRWNACNSNVSSQFNIDFSSFSVATITLSIYFSRKAWISSSSASHSKGCRISEFSYWVLIILNYETYLTFHFFKHGIPICFN